jgi:hypothetical protein
VDKESGMRVVTQISSFYDWEPVPADVKVTPQDIKAGRVKPSANGGYLMRVTRKHPTENTTLISEETIIRRIIHEMMPNQGCVPHSRTEAIGQIMARQVMPDQAHPKFMTGFQIDDDGPDEKLFLALVTPYTKVTHEQSGRLLIDPEDVPMLLAKYMEKTTPQNHVDHLCAKFSVKKAVTP